MEGRPSVAVLPGGVSSGGVFRSASAKRMAPLQRGTFSGSRTQPTAPIQRPVKEDLHELPVIPVHDHVEAGDRWRPLFSAKGGCELQCVSWGRAYEPNCLDLTFLTDNRDRASYQLPYFNSKASWSLIAPISSVTSTSLKSFSMKTIRA